MPYDKTGAWWAAPLNAAAEIISRGGVVAIPTDTVYGLACDPADPAAVERIYEIKCRPGDLELTLLAADAEALGGLVLLPAFAAELAARFWPGPLSMVLPVGPRRLSVPRRGTTLSVRVPAHALLRELLRRTGPLASTSANRHGEPDTATADEVRAQLGDEVDVLVDGGTTGGVASTIIDCAVRPPRILREGPISHAELTPYLGGRP